MGLEERKERCFSAFAGKSHKQASIECEEMKLNNDSVLFVSSDLSR